MSYRFTGLIFSGFLLVVVLLMQSSNSICCPIVDCPVKRYRHGERQRVFEHIRKNHEASTIPEDFRLRHSLEPCPFCGKLYVSRCAFTGFNALARHSKACSSRSAQSNLQANSLADNLDTATAAVSFDSSSLSVTSLSNTCNGQVTEFELSSSRRSLTDEAIASSRVPLANTLSNGELLQLQWNGRGATDTDMGQTSNVKGNVDQISTSPAVKSPGGRTKGWEFLDNLDFESISGSIIPTISNVPRHLQAFFRECCAMSLVKLSENSSDLSAWKLFLLTPRFLLQPVTRGGKCGKKEHESRYKKFRELRFDELYHSSVPRPDERQNKFECPDSDSVISSSLIRSVRSKVRNGEISRAGNLLTSSGLATTSLETFQRLQEKHPQRKNLISEELKHHKPTCSPVQVSLSLFISVLKNCPNGSSCGFNGWRFEHLKLLLDSDYTTSHLHSLCNSYLSGSVPDVVATTLAGAKLIALQKNVNDVRPIAVGDSFRRLTAKLACHQLKKKISTFLAPHQYGVSTPGGAELMTHLIQASLEEHPEWIVIKTDAKNAFNTVDRSAFLSEVASIFPELYPFVAQCYIPPAKLTVRVGCKTQFILSEEGVQQGDPLGPLLFALALQPILINAAKDHESVLTPSYLDDSMILGPKEEVINCYNNLKVQLSKIGLELREDKCEAFSPIGIHDWPLNIPVQKNGFVVLGTPIGSLSFVKDRCMKQVNTAKTFLSKLPYIDDTQSAMLILRYCGIPKISHLLRCVPPTVTAEATREFDVAIINTFEAIIGCKLSEQQRVQLFFRFSQGGFGLSQMSVTAPCAFLGARASTLHQLPLRVPSLASFCDTVITPARICDDRAPSVYSIADHLIDSLQEIKLFHTDRQSLISSLADLPNQPFKLQSRLYSRHLDTQFQTFLKGCSSEYDKARVISCGGPIAGSWLDVIPNTQEFTMSNMDFRVASLLRLGAPLPELQALDNCIPQCKQPLDSSGYHILTCKWGGGIIRRHDHIADCLYKMLTSVGYRCRKELPDQFDGKQRPDVAVYDYKDGKKLLLDVTIAHPAARKYISKSHSVAGFAATEREKQKNTKYLSKSRELGYLFKPFAMEVFGRWSDSAQNFLSETSKFAASTLQISSAEFLHMWRRRFATCLQKENVSIMSEKMKSLVPKTTVDANFRQKQPVRCFGLDFI